MGASKKPRFRNLLYQGINELRVGFARILGGGEVLAGDRIDAGVEILPMQSLQAQKRLGVSYYEDEFYSVIRQGRSAPAIPLVLLGIDA